MLNDKGLVRILQGDTIIYISRMRMVVFVKDPLQKVTVQLGVSKSWTEEMAGLLTIIVIDAGDIRVVVTFTISQHIAHKKPRGSRDYKYRLREPLSS